MKVQTEQKIDMLIYRISWYSVYVDCFSRILNEFIQNGDSNLNPNDVPNLSEYLTKMTTRLYQNILQLKNIREFEN